MLYVKNKVAEASLLTKNEGKKSFSAIVLDPKVVPEGQ